MTELKQRREKSPKTGKILYIIEAALEYFVALSVSGIFLATLTTYIGISDSNTGLLSSILSLGFSFQILALFIPRSVSSKKLALSPLVSFIQKNGNRLFGIKIYAQQITSAISVTACAIAIIYTLTVLRKLKRNL